VFWRQRVWRRGGFKLPHLPPNITSLCPSLGCTQELCEDRGGGWLPCIWISAQDMVNVHRVYKPLQLDVPSNPPNRKALW
jgi:hypothetical protein